MDNIEAWKDADIREDDTDHPAGEIKVSRRTRIGARVSALSGFAVATLAMSTLMDSVCTTSSKA